MKTLLLTILFARFINDPFWDKYFPPLGWNCRCTAVQVRKDKYPVSDSTTAMQAGEKATESKKQQIFRFNPGKEGKVFPPKHPYLPKGCEGCDKNKLNLPNFFIKKYSIFLNTNQIWIKKRL